MDFVLKLRDKEEFCRVILFVGVAIFIVCMPLGKFFISLSTITICVGIIVLAALLGPRKLAINGFSFRWLLLAVILWLGVKVIWSINPSDGVDAYKNALYKGFSLFIVGMEISRRREHFLLLPLLFFIVALYQGLDGVWQFYTGRDFINGDPMLDGRLTGSLSTYRVGNFIAMALVPALVMPWVMRTRHGGWKLWALTFLAFAPSLFLLVFSSTRSGYICLVVSLCAMFSILRGFSWKMPVALLVAAVGLAIFYPDRFGLAELMRDGRLELWNFAIEIFKAYPLAGSGLYTFNTAFHSLGLVPRFNPTSIPHPHNIYLQVLCETGIIGFILFSTLLLGMLVWGGKILRARIKDGDDPAYWLTAAAFWAAGVGYAVMGLTAHDFLRDWWFGLAWLQLGFASGACAWKNKAAVGCDAIGLQIVTGKFFDFPVFEAKISKWTQRRSFWVGIFCLAAFLFIITLNPFLKTATAPWQGLFLFTSLLNIAALCGIGLILPRWLYFIGSLFLFNLIGLFSYIAAKYGVWPSVGLICSLVEAAPSEVNEFITSSKVGLIVGLNLCILLFSHAFRRMLPKFKLWYFPVFIALIAVSYKFPGGVIQEEAHLAIKWPLDFISPPVRDSVRYFNEERPRAAALLNLPSPASLPSKRMSGDPLIVVYVMGESVRADHLGVYGYARDTTPQLAKRENLLVYKDVTSFAAWTRESTIGLLTNADMKNRTPTLGCFVDIFKVNGFKDYAYTNRLKPNWNDLPFELLTRQGVKRVYVPGMDKSSISVFKRYMDKGGDFQFHIFYTNGSHIDYNVRYPRKEAYYLPDDYENVPSEIALQARINAYDNTVRYLDGFIDGIIALLKDKNAVLLYTSDHGESLGEEGRLLHSNMNAPEQRFVPFLIWYSDEYARLNPDKVRQMREKLNQPISHDYVFHTMLGLGDFETKVRDKSLDLTQ